MKLKTGFLLLLAFLISYAAAAQPRITYKVNPGESVEEAIPLEGKFYYPEFKAGSVLFRNGNFGASRMNLSFLMGEMQFINGIDTLSVDHAEEIRHVIIERDTFYFQQKVWVRQIFSNGHIRLAERKYLAFANREKIGAFGQVNSGSSIDAVENLVTTSNITKKLQTNQIITFELNTTYYMGDRFDNYKLANRKNVMNLFGNRCPGLNNFLENEKIDFLKAVDMQKLYDFIVANWK